MDINECISYLRDTGVNVDEAERDIDVIRSALVNSENALLDYVDKFEKIGATMGYGRAVIVTVRVAMMTIGAKSMVTHD